MKKPGLGGLVHGNAILTRRLPAPQTEIAAPPANLAEVYVREKRFTEAANALDQVTRFWIGRSAPITRTWCP